MFFITPPRPEGKIHPRQLPSIEREGGRIAQPKYDGDRRCVATEGRDIASWNRHGQKRTLDPKIAKEMRSLKLPKGFAYFDGEYLSQLGVLALFDILHCARTLVGVYQLERLALLADICRNPQDTCLSGFAHPITEHIWMAPQFSCQFTQLYQKTLPLKGTIEGILLRDIDSYLGSVATVGEFLVNWQLRCRQPAKGRAC